MDQLAKNSEPQMTLCVHIFEAKDEVMSDAKYDEEFQHEWYSFKPRPSVSEKNSEMQNKREIGMRTSLFYFGTMLKQNNYVV